MSGQTDWRLRSVTHLAEDWTSPWSNETVSKGAQVTIVTIARTKSGKLLTLPLPNATALMINSSHRSYQKALLLRRKHKIDDGKSQESSFKSNPAAFEYLEHLMASVLTAHAGLEAFANDQIPEDYEYISHRRSDVILDVSDKTTIQRHISLSEKISSVIPEILGTKSPKGNSKSWDDFKNLKALRDRITHMKTEDRKSAQPDVDTVWHALVNAESPYKQALSVISYFMDSQTSTPRWYSECPIS